MNKKQLNQVSDPIWINNKNNKENNNSDLSSSSSLTNNSYDSGFDYFFNYKNNNNNNSMNSNKNLSPPDYKRSFSSGSYSSSISSNASTNNRFNDSNNNNNDYFKGFTRRRTLTVGNENDNTFTFNNDHFQSPFQFQRSNSLSNGSEPNFGGIIKKSIGQLFNAATMNTSLATAPIQKSVPKVKCVSTFDTSNFARRNSNERSDQIKDHMVSYLCESAIR